jgi:hypothetical protein
MVLKNALGTEGEEEGEKAIDAEGAGYRER